VCVRSSKHDVSQLPSASLLVASHRYDKVRLLILVERVRALSHSGECICFRVTDHSKIVSFESKIRRRALVPQTSRSSSWLVVGMQKHELYSPCCYVRFKARTMYDVPVVAMRYK